MLLFAVALATGMQVHGDGVDLFGLVVLALLVNVTATLWAAGVAMRLRTIQAGPAMQMPVFILLFLAPVYVPLGLLSGWIEAVARVNPFTALLEGGRDLISGGDVRTGLVYGVASCCSRCSRSGPCAACAGPRRPADGDHGPGAERRRARGAPS